MVKVCCYGLCKNSTRKNPTVKFLPFPNPKTNLERAKRWVHLCGRPSFFFSIENITKYTYICVKHFGRGENLDLRANLTLEPFPAHSEELFRLRHEQNLLRQPMADLNAADSEETTKQTNEAAVSPPKVLKVLQPNKSYSKVIKSIRFLPLIPPSPAKVNDQIDQMKGNYIYLYNIEDRRS
jgi:hypothetical protein